jgi:uncharacterized protein
VDFVSPGDLRSKESLRFAFVQEQGFDRSCGYSAAASLLGLYWDLPVDEADLISRYAENEAQEDQLGVSFAGLARIFQDYGFSVKALRMDWDQLCAALDRFAPIVIHYERPDRHFALALRAREGWIILLDPALGCELLDRERFMRRWSGAALLAASSSATRDDPRMAEAESAAWGRLSLLEKKSR